MKKRMDDAASYLILGFMARHPLTTSADLLAAGVSRRDLSKAVERGDVVRHARGVLCSPSAQADPLLDYAAACLATGGIICGSTAGMHHGLTDDPAPEIEVLLPIASTRGDRFTTAPIKRVRSRVPESFTLGVESLDVLGTTMRITGRARTVVDLFRMGSRQHAVAALHGFLADSGTGEELRLMAEPFGSWGRLAPLVEMAMEGVSRAPVP